MDAPNAENGFTHVSRPFFDHFREPGLKGLENLAQPDTG